MTSDSERQDPTRDRLIEAGLTAYDELSLAKVFAGVTTKSVASSAGVTTGSFFHHFANSAEFADAMVRTFLQTPNDLTENVEEMVESLEHLDLLEVMRSALLDTWQVHSTDDGIRTQIRLQMAVWAHHAQALDTPDEETSTVADVLRQNYRVRHVDAVRGWQHLLSLTGRTFIEPFTLDQVAVALTALFEGLLIRHQLDPDVVDDGLFGDVSAAVATALTVPRGSRMRLADLTDAFFDQSTMSPQARSGAKRRRATAPASSRPPPEPSTTVGKPCRHATSPRRQVSRTRRS